MSNPAHSLDEPAFRQLFTETYRALVAYARRRVASHQVDDVVGEVYATAWRRRTDFNLDAPPLPWLYGIAANVVRNLQRADGRHLRLVERIEAEPAHVGHSMVDPADRAGVELRAALERLSFDDQEVLRLVAWEGLPHVEVGQILGCSTNAVGVRVHRARKRLEIELERLVSAEATQLQPNPQSNPPSTKGNA